MNNATTINIFDCGCVLGRPKEQSCRSYGTRWRVYCSTTPDGRFKKILLKCRDCGRLRHFVLTENNPVLIQYGKIETIDEEALNDEQYTKKFSSGTT